MQIYGTILAIVVLLLFGAACSAEVSEGRGTIPVGMESDLVPDVDYQVYLYFGPEAPVSLDYGRFLTSDQEEIAVLEGDEGVSLASVSIVATSLEQFGGALRFDSDNDAEFVSSLLGQSSVEDPTFIRVGSSVVEIVRGDSIWTEQVVNQLQTAELVSLKETNPLAWNMLTNLPVSEADPPIAAGFISTGGDLLQQIADHAGIRVPGLETAFGMVRVDNVAFGIYSNVPAEIPENIDVDFLAELDTGIVLVGGAGYAGVAVAFLVRSIAGKIGMDTVGLGNTNARYLKLEDGHLIIKNKGSLIYATLAGTRSRAEDLMLRALAE